VLLAENGLQARRYLKGSELKKPSVEVFVLRRQIRQPKGLSCSPDTLAEQPIQPAKYCMLQAAKGAARSAELCCYAKVEPPGLHGHLLRASTYQHASCFPSFMSNCFACCRTEWQVTLCGVSCLSDKSCMGSLVCMQDLERCKQHNSPYRITICYHSKLKGE